MSQKIHSTTPTIDVYIRLAQYPILCDQIRMQMREELFRRGIVDATEFELEVKNLALDSQRREGVMDPFNQEDETTWQRRIDIIRDLHTDNYFGNNLGVRLLDELIKEILSDSNQSPSQTHELTFNPEIAPWALLFRQGKRYETIPPPKQAAVKHHLEELKVVLIKRLISDHLSFIGISKRIFSIADLHWIYDRLTGAGKIGGKAAGMMLALKILQKEGTSVGPDISQLVDVPETDFIGSEIIYEFIYLNKMERFVNQKYLSLEEVDAQYPTVVDACLNGKLPDYIVEQLKEILKRVNGRPYTVRSSSLLEHNIKHSFADKYDSWVCINQGSEKSNLVDLLNAVRLVYASTFNPKAMQERQEFDLIDYDERMALMVQPLVGEQYGRFFWPTIIGTGLSKNPFPLNKGEKAEDGIIRLVWGIDDRSDTPFEDDNASIISLSQPKCRISKGQKHPQQSPQTIINVVDLEKNEFNRLPIEDVLQPDYPYLKYIASILDGDTLKPIPHDLKHHSEDQKRGQQLVLSFDYLTRDPKFVKLMRTTLMRLETVYKTPVKIDFAIELTPAKSGVSYKLYILQCHPQK